MLTISTNTNIQNNRHLWIGKAQNGKGSTNAMVPR